MGWMTNPQFNRRDGEASGTGSPCRSSEEPPEHGGSTSSVEGGWRPNRAGLRCGRCFIEEGTLSSQPRRGRPDGTLVLVSVAGGSRAAVEAAEDGERARERV
uniref:Uncharacterized protein n=1 Tax=Arundo donax TaxID=35708 RepID=A0A0A8XP45_ARUDO